MEQEHKPRTSMILLLEHVHAMDELTNEELGTFVRNYAKYVETGIEPAYDNDRAMRMLWKVVKAFAQSTGTLVVALAQLNRETARTGIPPTAADLRESGQIEQDADAIILLAQNVTTKKRPEQHYHFALEKNKEGNVGSLDITFQMETQQFKECV